MRFLFFYENKYNVVFVCIVLYIGLLLHFLVE